MERFNPRPMVFDPCKDLQEVDQFGFVDLASAFENGIIPSFDYASDDAFNGVTNPGTLISRNADIFDGIRKAEYVQSMLSRLNASDREKVENVVERANDASGVTSD